MQITEAYRAQNRALHESRPDYGTSGQRWAEMVTDLCAKLNTRDVLDYGCGKGTLSAALGFSIKEYDPCIDGKEAMPKPASIVVCTDVLEHIEPECLDDVLSDIRRCTRSLAFLTVATAPAKKTLPDGRNAHICLMSVRAWLEHLTRYFHPLTFQDIGHEFIFVARPL